MDAGMVLLVVAIVIGASVGAWWGEKVRSRRRERWPDG
jgi:hypothetical protein